MMTRASNKADGIAYSWHDMPVEFSSPKGNLKNYYSANGTKLKTVVEPAGGGDVSTIHYFSGIEYKDEELHTAYWEDGRANFAESEAQHEYYLKDHLDNRTMLATASQKVTWSHFLVRAPKTPLRVGWRVRFADKKHPITGEADGIITYDPSDPENDEVLSTHQYYPFDDRLIIATAIKKVIRNHFLRREPKTLLRVGGWDVPNVDSNGNSLLPTDGETRYTYNGKEFQSELGLDLHYYGFRVYDPAIGRFTSVDPIAEEFAFVSGFNYAENEPIANIDLHGLQKVNFTKAMKSNETFDQAYTASRQTSGGKKFDSTLKGQNKVDVVYSNVIFADGITKGPFGSKEEIKDAVGKSSYLQSVDSDEISSFLEDGKSLLIIGVNCSDDCSSESIMSAAETINHEEVAHGINAIDGKSKGVNQEHKEFQNNSETLSPGSQEIRNDPKYKNTEAKKQLNELDKILGNEN